MQSIKTNEIKSHPSPARVYLKTFKPGSTNILFLADCLISTTPAPKNRAQSKHFNFTYTH